MLQISPVLFFLLIVGGCALVAGLGTLLFRKLVKIKVQRSHNEVTGFLFLAIASFYALLLSFIVLVVWEQLNETIGIVSKEGSTAMTLYRDIKYYPDTVRSKPLKTAYLNFVFDVVDDEFPEMARMERARGTSESFDLVFVRMAQLDPKTPMESMLVAEMMTQLNTLAADRGQRMTTMDVEIRPPLWMPIILGALITLLCAMYLDIERLRMHFILTALLGAFIGMFLFVIVVLDHPYSGVFGLKPDSYMQIFTSEKWSKELHDRTTIQLK
ncbi:MAG: DUF4239 domain-containing protein [Bacteroidetes bacterium]|nr:DUF4239 domain-containing protein [Bacteroidota bacterium]